MTARPRLTWHRLESGWLYIENISDVFVERYCVARHTGLYDDLDGLTCKTCLEVLDAGRTTCQHGPWSVLVEVPSDTSEPDPERWYWGRDWESDVGAGVGFTTAREAKVWAETHVPFLKDLSARRNKSDLSES
jgi:hypothetical protein